MGAKPGHEVSAETRAKISASLKGRKLGPSKLKGRKRSPESIAKQRGPRFSATCSVEDCDEPYAAKGMCRTHYTWMRRYGTTEPPAKREVGYHGVHIRARKVLPRQCAACGGTGDESPLEVALRHDAAEENLRVADRGELGLHAYSILEADYVRLCSRCHKRYDHTGPEGRTAIIAALSALADAAPNN
jgi:hypothetical protein